MIYNKDDYLKCFSCMHVCHKHETKTKDAGTTTEGEQFKLTVCPSCDSKYSMKKEFVGVPDLILHSVRVGTIDVNNIEEHIDEELKKEEIQSLTN